jgi:hypothetical protein
LDFNFLNQLQLWLGVALIVVILLSLNKWTPGWLLTRAITVLALGAVVWAKQFYYPSGKHSAFEICLVAVAFCLAGYWIYRIFVKRRGS